MLWKTIQGNTTQLTQSSYFSAALVSENLYGVILMHDAVAMSHKLLPLPPKNPVWNPDAHTALLCRLDSKFLGLIIFTYSPVCVELILSCTMWFICAPSGTWVLKIVWERLARGSTMPIRPELVISIIYWGLRGPSIYVYTCIYVCIQSYAYKLSFSMYIIIVGRYETNGRYMPILLGEGHWLLAINTPYPAGLPAGFYLPVIT